MTLNHHPQTTNDIHQTTQLALQGISAFQVELLNAEGQPLEFQRVDTASGNAATELKLPLPEKGSYQVRSSAFTADNAILGTTTLAAQLDSGENQVNIDTLGLSKLYYASNSHLPQTQSPQGLENFLAFDQPGISLQAYCFFGYLEDDNQGQMAYFSLLQRTDQIVPELDLDARLPLMLSGTGISTPDMGGFRVGGSAGPAFIGNTISLSQPWDLSINAPNPPGTATPQNTTRAQLISGTFGQKGAQYRIQSHGFDNKGEILSTDIQVVDTMGFVSEGFGANAFLPNWLYPEQMAEIHQNYNGSVEQYLAATQNPLTGQGSYYYSAPFLEVVKFTVSYVADGTVVSQGSGGLLWMDVVFQTFDDTATKIVKDATWSFFIMQFPEQKKALMTTLVGTPVSDYKVSSLFSMDAPQGLNGVLEPEYRWNLQDIHMEPVAGSEWESPVSGETYYTEYKILLAGDVPADLTVTMAWKDQEVEVLTRYVYEGLGYVTGTLDGETVNGTAWLEMQPIGTLN